MSSASGSGSGSSNDGDNSGKVNGIVGSVESFIHGLTNGSSSSSTDNNEIFGNCTELYERFSRCMAPSFQVSQIHKYGEAKSCTNRFGDWRKCISSKMMKDEAKIQVSLTYCQSHYHSS